MIIKIVKRLIANNENIPNKHGYITINNKKMFFSSHYIRKSDLSGGNNNGILIF